MTDIITVEKQPVVIIESAASPVIVESAVLPGAPGALSGSFEYKQEIPSAIWTVNHNLGYRPVVSILNTGGREMFAEILHTNSNQFIVYFDSPVTGLAIYS